MQKNRLETLQASFPTCHLSRRGGGTLGVVLDKFANPPRLYGQTEKLIQTEDDIATAFATIASRTTAATGVNDTSSRSHSILTLTLWRKTSDNKIRRTKFQFCDLAGSERMEEAHINGMQNQNQLEVLQRVMANWSLMELARCLQDIAMARKRGRCISLRLFLSSGTLLGSASTTCICCASTSETNWSQTLNTVSSGKRLAVLAGQALLMQK